MRYILIIITFFASIDSKAQNVYPGLGYVGLGTTTPGFKLDIINESGVPQNLFRVKVNGAPSDEFKIINMTGAAGQFIPALWGYHNSDNREVIAIVGATDASNDYGVNPVMSFDSRIPTGPISSRPLFSWGSYGNIKMLMSASGNLGLGTSTPAAKLHIETNSWAESLLTFKDTHYAPHQVFNFQIESDGLKIKQDNTTNYQFKSGGDFIVNNGNMGLGTYQPTGKLHINTNIWVASLLTLSDVHYAPAQVYNFQIESDGLKIKQDNTINYQFKSGGDFIVNNGAIRSKEVRVSLTPGTGPDYVFSNNYQLLTLNELMTYIDQNKHLPEVPSAAAMEANGINLGEMNMLLLKKVEELTLHLIEMKREIKDLRSISEAQENTIKELQNND